MPALRYTASAENDLLEAWLFVAEDNPPAADRVVDVIDREARNLLSHPRIGRERPELSPGLRSWPTSTRYGLFYFVDAAGIVIARVLHHARDTGPIGDWPQDRPHAQRMRAKGHSLRRVRESPYRKSPARLASVSGAMSACAG